MLFRSGEQHHRHQPRHRVLLEFTANREPVAARQHHVQQDQVRQPAMRPDERECRLAVADRLHLVAVRRQQAMRQHLFENKPSTRTRRLDGTVDVHSGDARKIKRLLAER